MADSDEEQQVVVAADDEVVAPEPAGADDNAPIQEGHGNMKLLDTGFSVPGNDIICNGFLYFDIEAVGPAIRILEITLKNGISTKAIVYSRAGSFAGHESDSAGWTLVGPDGFLLDSGDTAGLLLATEAGIEHGWEIVSSMHQPHTGVVLEDECLRCHPARAAGGTLFNPMYLYDDRVFLGAVSYRCEVTRVVCCRAQRADSGTLTIFCTSLAGEELFSSEAPSEATVEWLRSALAERLGMVAAHLKLVSPTAQILGLEEPIKILVPVGP